ncbi:MAG TPA: peptide ABC transporter substrate-binding protein [Bdellovibrionota bacterium]|nr:peptide ABC transporter substrate-binding protein [Bdellovibrionota bacterium]
MKRYALAFLLVLAAFVAISCGSKDNPANLLQTSNSQSTTQNQIVIGVDSGPDSLNPLFSWSSVATEMQGLLFEPMVEYDDQGVLQPRLVESIPTIENGGLVRLPDNKIQTTWVLNEGLKWSDGHPLTTEDFIFAYEVSMAEQFDIDRDYESRIEKMEAKDLRTLIVTWKETYPYSFLGHAFLPKHILEESYRENPQSLVGNAYNLNPIGNGPYKLEKWERGKYTQQISFIRNENFNGKRPSIDRIIYKIMPDSESLKTVIASSNIDAVSPTVFDIGDIDFIFGFEKQYNGFFRAVFRDRLSWGLIGINLDEPRLQDRRVRQALLYGLDRERITERLFHKKAHLAHSYLLPQDMSYKTDIKHYPYDIERAKQLLEEAGWHEGANGIRVNEKEERLSFSIITNSDNRIRRKMEEFIQEDWKKIGIELALEHVSWNTFSKETLSQRTFPHFALFGWSRSRSHSGETIVTSQKIPTAENNWQGGNLSGWKNSEIDTLYNKFSTTFEEGERKELLDKAQMLWAEELPFLPLFLGVDLSIVRKGIQNWKLIGESILPITWNAEEWEIIEDTSSLRESTASSFTNLPTEVIEDFQSHVYGKSFEEIVSYAESKGIQFVVTQFEDEYVDDTQYFDISEHYVDKTGVATDQFKKGVDIDYVAFFQSSPLEGITTGPAIFLKRKPEVETVYHEMIHALEFIHHSNHFESAFFSKYVDNEDIVASLDSLWEKQDQLLQQWDAETEENQKNNYHKLYLLAKLEYYVTKLFVEYLSDRQHILLAKYLYDQMKNDFERRGNLYIISKNLNKLKSQEHMINNGIVYGTRGILEIIFADVNSYGFYATPEEHEQLKQKVFQDVDTIRAESKNFIEYFEQWLARELR